jgi:hypothetical protein
MKFKEVEFSEVPIFDQFRSRLRALRPTYIPVKVGREFDVDLYRVYVQCSKTTRLPIDIPKNLLRDIEQNPHGNECNYTKELISNLDALIEAAIPGRVQL